MRFTIAILLALASCSAPDYESEGGGPPSPPGPEEPAEDGSVGVPSDASPGVCDLFQPSAPDYPGGALPDVVMCDPLFFDTGRPEDDWRLGSPGELLDVPRPEEVLFQDM
jgi:hypothetical protein